MSTRLLAAYTYNGRHLDLTRFARIDKDLHAIRLRES